MIPRLDSGMVPSRMEKLIDEKEKTKKELEYMENISIESMYMNDLLDLEKNIRI